MDERQVAEQVRNVAVALLPDLPAIGSGTAEYIFERVPEFARPEASAIAMAACQANSTALLDALVRGIEIDAMTPSEEVIGTTRDLVRAQIGLDTLLSGYQVGISYWCHRWTMAVETFCPDVGAPLALRIVDHGTTFLLSWLQRITERLSVEYRDEAERLAREWSMARTDEVRRILTSGVVDVEAASRRLDYDLTRVHVAVVVTRDGSDRATLESTAREICAAISDARPLLCRVDTDTVWCWVPTTPGQRPAPARAGVISGRGVPGRGVTGFRLSHHQALEAVRVARLADGRLPTVTNFADIELASLCSHDIAALRRFVTSVLGALAEPTPNCHLLRETLRTFYAANDNYRTAASHLDLHHNTIRYRLGRVESMLGRAVLDRRLETELALHVGTQLGLLPHDDDEHGK